MRGLGLGFKVCGLRLWLDFSDTVQGLKASQTQGSKDPNNRALGIVLGP